MKKRISFILLTIAVLTSFAFAAIADPVALASAYIANSNTGKFHIASCRWVSKMSESHKVYFDSRDEAVNSGYVPCKVCHP